MAIYTIDTAYPHLMELVELGRVGEFGLAMEIGHSQRKHHCQFGIEVFTYGNIDMVVEAMTALLMACLLRDNLAATVICEVHDKGDDRSKEV